jgi:hypothetical protein
MPRPLAVDPYSETPKAQESLGTVAPIAFKEPGLKMTVSNSGRVKYGIPR